MRVKKAAAAALALLAACVLMGCSSYITYDFTGQGGPGAIDLSGYAKQYEALEWLEGNPNKYAFAGNRFEDSQAAKEFIQNLYDLGATEVLITGVLDEEWRIKEEGGPYADTLIVTLPADREKREAIFKIYLDEFSNEYDCDYSDIRGGMLYFWWD